MEINFENCSKTFVSFQIVNYGPHCSDYPLIDYKKIVKEQEVKEQKMRKERKKEKRNEERNNEEKKMELQQEQGQEGQENQENQENQEDKLQQEEKQQEQKKENKLPQLSLKRNRYDNIIERLERKYCGAIIMNSNSDSSNDDEEGEGDDEEDGDGDENGSEGESEEDEEDDGEEEEEEGEEGREGGNENKNKNDKEEGHNENGNGNNGDGKNKNSKDNKNTSEKKRKRGTSRAADYYDMDDSFIDDTDNIASVEEQIKMKKVQTKHAGFFVSSGQLEVDSQLTLGFISDTQKEKALKSIASIDAQVSSMISSIINKSLQSKVNNSTSNSNSTSTSNQSSSTSTTTTTTTTTTLKSIPQSLLTEFYELDTLTKSKNIDLVKVLSKLKSPYRVCVDFILQQLFIPNSEVTFEEQMDNLFELLKKQLNKKRSLMLTPNKTSNLRLILERQMKELAEKIREKIEPAVSANPTSTSTSNTSPSDGKPSEGLEENGGSSKEFQWVCKWDMALRGQLYDVEQLCRQWVDMENTSRQTPPVTTSSTTSNGAATVVPEKKKKSQSEELLSHHSEITKLFTQISSIAFAAPYSETTVDKGGVSGIRKALTTEKGRIKKKERNLAGHSIIPGTSADSGSEGLPLNEQKPKSQSKQSTTQSSSTNQVKAIHKQIEKKVPIPAVDDQNDFIAPTPPTTTASTTSATSNSSKSTTSKKEKKRVVPTTVSPVVNSSTNNS